MENEKKIWYKQWWGIILIILFWIFLVPIVLYQSKISKKKKIIFSIIYIIFMVFTIPAALSDDTAKVDTETQKKDKKANNEQKQETEKKQENPKEEIEVTKNNKTGEYILQILVPENASHDEIYKAIMSSQLEKRRKDFLNDDIIVAVYSDKNFMYKGLLGTHAQWKVKKGVEEYMKISPKTEKISDEERKLYLEYLEIVNSLLDTGDELKKAKQEAEALMKARYPENYKEIIKKAENYLWGIEKEKTEKEKFEEQMKNPDPNSEYQKFKKQKEEEEKNGK